MIESAMKELPNKIIYNFQETVPFKQAILFGAGGRGYSALQFLRSKGVEVLFFVDNGQDKHGTELHGLPVKSPEAIQETPGVPVVIASHFYSEIMNQLDAMGVADYYFNFRAANSTLYRHDLIERNMARINEVFEGLADEASRRSYASIIKMFHQGDEGYTRPCGYPIYAHPLVLPRPGDVIADVGAFDGDTAFDFDKHCGHDCTIYCFEPSANNYDALLKNIYENGMDQRMIPIKMGLWDSMQTLSFQQDHESPTASKVGEGDSSIFGIELDRLAERQGLHFDFIKMDIEGAEPNALRGAAETLKRDRPDLQICLYHSPDHLWEIPLYVKSLVPEYTMYIGQHDVGRSNTVLYATCRNQG